jgi:hypothetical protein
VRENLAEQALRAVIAADEALSTAERTAARFGRIGAELLLLRYEQH